MTKSNGIAFAVIISGNNCSAPTVKAFWRADKASEHAACMSEAIEKRKKHIEGDVRVDCLTLIIDNLS